MKEIPDEVPQVYTSITAPKVYGAIQSVMKELGRDGISKAHRNKQQGFDFRGIDDVYAALNVALVAHGLLMLPRVSERTLTQRTAKQGGTLFCVAIRLEIDLVAVADGSKHTISAYGEGMDSGDKATSKAESIAFKYAAFQAFCIPVDGVPDTDSESPEPASDSESLRLIQNELSERACPLKRILGAYGVQELDEIPSERHAEILQRLRSYPKKSHE